MQELITLEKLFPEFATKDSPTQQVGSDLKNTEQGGILTEFAQYPHKYPMLSLSNTYDYGELNAFNERIAKATSLPYTFSCELKFDGTAICLTYKKENYLEP
jgi:NAD-dependent DNA ligase (contains BRCT domain type II)